MPQPNTAGFSFQPSRQMPLAAGLAVLLLAGCSAQRMHTSQATPSTPAATVATAPVSTQPSQTAPAPSPEATQVEKTTTADSTPDVAAPPSGTGPDTAAAATANPNTQAAQSAPSTEDKDMTVLVLDNEKLLAQAARLKPEQTPVPTRDSLQQPRKTVFHYAFDAHKLSDADRAILQAHGRYLAEHPNLRVQLIGHTDAQGPKDYNLFLSRLRAADAAKVMEEAGAKANQIDIEGVGSSQPESPEGDYAANRRLDVRYLNPALAESR